MIEIQINCKIFTEGCLTVAKHTGVSQIMCGLIIKKQKREKVTT